MTIPQLLLTMCTDLPDSDLNAIRKARGFNAGETASRSAFASFFVTGIGLVEALAALTPEEAVTLRLLHESGEVDVAFFARLYPSGYEYGTYSQRHKITLDAVKKNLVRRGLLIMAELKTRTDLTAMERWRFALPPEFASYLPPLPRAENAQNGLTNDSLVRKKFSQIVGQNQDLNDPMPLVLKSGRLWLKDQVFSLESFRAWQLLTWNFKSATYKPDVPASLAPTLALLKLLDEKAWVNPKDIDPALKIYCFGGKIPLAAGLLQVGWELGLLARLEIDSVPHYRLAPAAAAGATDSPYPATLAWADTTSQPGSVKIDLRLIPLYDLHLLNALTYLDLRDGHLCAAPSLIKLGRAFPAQRGSRLARWLASTIPAFGQAAETVDAKWGKTLLHENLLIAHVRDLSLRVQLERELGADLVVLDQHYVAFPPAWRAEVEKILKKAGFVVKTVKA